MSSKTLESAVDDDTAVVDLIVSQPKSEMKKDNAVFGLRIRIPAVYSIITLLSDILIVFSIMYLYYIVEKDWINYPYYTQECLWQFKESLNMANIAVLLPVQIVLSIILVYFAVKNVTYYGANVNNNSINYNVIKKTRIKYLIVLLLHGMLWYVLEKLFIISLLSLGGQQDCNNDIYSNKSIMIPTLLIEFTIIVKNIIWMIIFAGTMVYYLYKYIIKNTACNYVYTIGIKSEQSKKIAIYIGCWILGVIMVTILWILSFTMVLMISLNHYYQIHLHLIGVGIVNILGIKLSNGGSHMDAYSLTATDCNCECCSNNTCTCSCDDCTCCYCNDCCNHCYYACCYDKACCACGDNKCCYYDSDLPWNFETQPCTFGGACEWCKDNGKGVCFCCTCECCQCYTYD